MFMTLTGELSWQRLRRSVVDFYTKNEKSLFGPPFRALRGNVRTPSMARWKARGRLYIRRNWTFFAISYGWDVMSGNRSKSTFFEGGGSLWAQISEGRALPTNHCWYQSSRVIARYQNICSASFSFVTIHESTRVTDRRTDGGRTDRQNYDSQDRPRICSCGKIPLQEIWIDRVIKFCICIRNLFTRMSKKAT